VGFRVDEVNMGAGAAAPMTLALEEVEGSAAAGVGVEAVTAQ
jgi:hypothetical protein